MEGTAPVVDIRASSAKKRIPKACQSCRASKVRCDEQRPSCTRCQGLNRPCIYIEKPKSVDEQKIEELEHEVLSLRQQLQAQQLHIQTTSFPTDGVRPLLPMRQMSETTSPHSMTQSSPSIDQPLKRKRSHFQLEKEIMVPSFITEGLISEPQAMYYFNAFFEGCDRYVPVFDSSDTFYSVRLRSSFLLNAICAVGCGMVEDAAIDNRVLLVKLKRWLTIVILSSHIHVLETVQALLVMACWMRERDLILAIATRMALELHLDDAFDRLVNVLLRDPDAKDIPTLMKRARTWFGLLVLEKILQVDAGNLLGLKLKGVRRFRMLLNRPFSTKIDPRLFAQAELNHLRAKINEKLTRNSDEVVEAVLDARVDLDIWYNDWRRIMETSPVAASELPLLLANLDVQKHWADAMAACRAVRTTGIHNIDMMSPEHREVLGMAREALHNHLHVMLTQPQYIANFKYAMDFVWAKCAFSFLLLLKLTILIPGATNADEELLSYGRALYHELSKYARSGSSKVYLRLLQISIEKYSTRDEVQTGELDTWIPEEFIFEWDFPGLNLFSSPGGWDLLFDQYLLGDDLFTGIGT